MQNQKLLIFIAGAPAKSTKHELLEFFRRIGSINSIQPRLCRGDLRRETLPYPPTKVYWLLEASDLASYYAILGSEPCMFQDRKLYLAPFKSGTQLIVHNNGIAKRRVLVKKVPSWLPETSLMAMIEKGFGPIATYFKFQSDVSNLETLQDTQKPRRFFTYSVTFQNKSDRDDIVSSGFVQITQDVAVAVEKFVHLSVSKKKKLSEQNAEVPTNLNPSLKSLYETQTCISKHQDSFANNTQEWSEELLTDSRQESQADDRRVSIKRNHLASSALRDTKPTQRNYHLGQQKLVGQAAGRCINKNSFQDDRNLRFNIAENPFTFNGRVVTKPQISLLQ
jgi:hypothetical protein